MGEGVPERKRSSVHTEIADAAKQSLLVRTNARDLTSQRESTNANRNPVSRGAEGTPF